MKITSIILAAGQGTRMKSTLPKVMHSILGYPMIWYAVTAVQDAVNQPPVVVIGHGAESVQDAIGQDVQTVIQEEQLGTGHAVQQAESLLQGNADIVLVTYGDMPLIKSDTLKRLVAAQKEHEGPITMLTISTDTPRGFGRIVRSENGKVQAIVEEVDATPEQLSIRELNPGVYCYDANWLWGALKKVALSPKGEYYLTDLVEIAVSEGQSVNAIEMDDLSEMIGINTRVHLAEAAATLRQRINHELMLGGVTIIDPNTTYVAPGVEIGKDTIIWPNTHIQGRSKVGENCEIGPNTLIRDSQIGNRCKAFASVIESALLEDDVDIGPFGHLRKGAHLANGVHMGNFGEVKNSYLGPGTKMGHFSYLGDATTGENVNIGAGTITCNYDGEKKHATEIGADVFIGSDTMLVAPLKLGDSSRTGAGSVVTKDVQENTLVVGIPARAIRKIYKEK